MRLSKSKDNEVINESKNETNLNKIEHLFDLKAPENVDRIVKNACFRYTDKNGCPKADPHIKNNIEKVKKVKRNKMI